jgi:DNA-binding response OmpR family regulator
LIQQEYTNLDRVSKLTLVAGGDNSLQSKSGTIKKKKKVVLVDDDRAILKIYRDALTYAGFDVLAAMSDGVELAESIDGMSPKPDVIILDERMPRMSGVEACNLIRSRYPDISIIFVSADSSAEKAALKAGAKRFLTKPVSIAQLSGAIDSA